MDELAKLDFARQAVILVPLSVLLVVSAYTDYRTRKIYNKYTYPALLVGLVCHTIVFGLDGLLAGLLAAVVMLVIGLGLLMFNLIGAGDIKLLIVVGAFLGGQGLAEVVFYSILAGAVGGLINATLNGYLIQMLRNMGRFFRSVYRMVVYRSSTMWEPFEKDERSWIPFAIAILGGGILTWTDAMYGQPELWTLFERLIYR